MVSKSEHGTRYGESREMEPNDELTFIDLGVIHHLLALIVKSQGSTQPTELSDGNRATD